MMKRGSIMKKAVSLVIVCVLMLGALIGCGGGDTPGSDDRTVSIQSPTFNGTDLYQLSGDSAMTKLIADPILTMLPDGSIGGGIAEGYDVSEDGKEITLTFSEGFQFADGTPLTPADVKRSIEYGLETSAFNFEYDSINQIDVDGNDIILHLDHYQPGVLLMLSNGMMPVYPASQLDSMTKEELLFGALPYGAYYVESYTEGSEVILKRNEYYHTNNPLVDNKDAVNIGTIDVKLISDSFATVSSIQTGELDLAVQWPAEQLDQLSDIENYTYRWNTDWNQYYIILNDSSPILQDERVREAIMHLTDQHAIAEKSGGRFSETTSLIPSIALGYSQDAADYYADNYGYDPDKAAALLSEAGWTDSDGDGILDKDGEKLSFSLMLVSPETEDLAEHLQILLKSAGIQMDIDSVDVSLASSSITDDSYDAAFWSIGWGNAYLFLKMISQDPSMLDDTYFSMVEEASVIADDEEREAAYAKCLEYAYDLKTFVPIAQHNVLIVYNDETLNGIKFGVTGRYYLNDIQ